MAEEKKQKKEEVTAPFNVAVATLMRVDKLLKRYHEISLHLDWEIESKMDARRTAIRDLIVQSAPLLKSETTTKLMEDLKKIKIEFKYDKNNEILKDSKLQVQSQLDNLIIKVQQKLQDEGKYLMPSSKDPRFNWGQG